MKSKQEVIQEAWEDVIGYENLYQVSNLGKVRSLDKIVSNGNGSFLKKGIVLKPYLDKDGYATVNLYKNRKKRLIRIHRLVAMAFIPNSNNKPAINHKNSIRDDNRVENLEWVSVSENNKHAFEYGNQIPNRGDKCWTFNIDPNNHPSAKKVIHLSSGRIFGSLREATKELGIKYSSVLSKINLKSNGFNDTGLLYLDDLNAIPKNLQIRIGTTIFEYKLIQPAPIY
ncbi:NUMOD4 domain-containing protein [Sphingobacterium multivorum]|uniref:NUMOD4 motif n=1 Tax=Sphingobacterium multivorum TaxID=28454 RepID=A0A654D1G7_SPHMU|nr:NUMOD4 domain-containing protein [Sphingobacterium multivorum]VXC99475.1 conserved hypothetical protein [Sphingobacterium multivorum]